MSVLIDEPDITLQRSISKNRTYIPEAVCQSMYAKLLTDVIKPANDTALDNYLNEVYKKIVRRQKDQNEKMVYVAVIKKKEI